jgi:hypothetical protein
MATSRTPIRKLKRQCPSEAGNVFVEYVIVLALVSVGAVAALVAAGPPLLALSRMQRAWIELPFP